MKSIFTKERVAAYNIHRSTVENFLILITIEEGGIGVEVKNESIANMEAKGSLEIQNILKSDIGFIAKGDNLLDAKKIMDSNKLIQDVLVTENRRKEEPVIRWISNVITHKSKL